MQLIVKTLAGLENILEKELSSLTDSTLLPIKRGVIVENATIRDLYRINYESRLALRVLMDLAKTKIKASEDALYDFVYEQDWTHYIKPSQTIALDSVVFSDYFTHSNYVALKAKDAIVDKIRSIKGSRPNVDSKNPDIRIHIHINRLHELSISLDSSGESLHKRAYRKNHYIAPLNEVLAAGIIRLSGWNQKEGFYDPMCGSGTLAAEALMLASNTPARYLNPKFAFQNWGNYDQKLWFEVKNEADQKQCIPECEIYAHDLASKAVEVSKFNMRNLPFGQLIQVNQRNFLNRGSIKNVSKLYFNPPYDKRISFHRLNEFYKSMGDKLKKDYQNTEAWIITANAEAMKSFGLRPSKKHSLFNGALDCILYQYQLYGGSKKSKFVKKSK